MPQPRRAVEIDDLTTEEREVLRAVGRNQQPAVSLAMANLMSADPPLLSSNRAITSRGRSLADKLGNAPR